MGYAAQYMSLLRVLYMKYNMRRAAEMLIKHEVKCQVLY